MPSSIARQGFCYCRSCESGSGFWSLALRARVGVAEGFAFAGWPQPGQQARSALLPATQSRAALLRPGGKKPDGPFAVWRIGLCAATPHRAGAQRPAAPQGRSPRVKGEALGKAGPPFCGPAEKSQTALLPSGVLAYAPPPRAQQARSALRPRKGPQSTGQGRSPCFR